MKEFGCNENRYDPYQDGAVPKFRDEKRCGFDFFEMMQNVNFHQWN